MPLVDSYWSLILDTRMLNMLDGTGAHRNEVVDRRCDLCDGLDGDDVSPARLLPRVMQ